MMRFIVLGMGLLVVPSVLACTVVDDSGQIVKLDHPAKRIISLAPDLTEILFAAGAGKSVVGVSQGSDYPPLAKKIPVVANFNGIDSEAALALKPDLIIAWSAEKWAAPLTKFGVPVYFSDQHHITDIPVTLKKLACLAGTESTANVAIKHFQQQYAYLQQRYAHKKNITVFYQIWATPVMTITKNSWMNDVINLCGGTNIFANLTGVAPAVSIEAVIAANPVMIVGTHVSVWQKWSKLKAIKHHHLFSLNPDLLERAGPRLLEGAKQLCEKMEVARDSK